MRFKNAEEANNFQQELAEAARESSWELDQVTKTFETFVSKHMSKLSRQELDLFRNIIEHFDQARELMHKVYVFAKYTEAV